MLSKRTTRASTRRAAFVGPPDQWAVQRRVQFEFLTSQGLRPEDRLIDIRGGGRHHLGRLGVADPTLGANQLVGTDLTQAVPLTLAAALGALAFGHVEFGITTSLILGSVPAVLLGSLFSSSAPDRYVRPAITFVVGASGLKYVGVGTTARMDPLRGAVRRGVDLGRAQPPLAQPATAAGRGSSGHHAAARRRPAGTVE